jgi:uncharacterized membrane protein
MFETLVTILLWFSAIGCGVLAGLYFAFSAFIMKALGRIGQVQGVAAMNSINSTILQSLFMPLFFGTTLTSLALAAIAVIRWGETGSSMMFAAGSIYVLGMFVCTMLFNVPLNNVLAAADPNGTDAALVWARYVREWTRWNHVRTLTSIAASVLYIAVIAAR